MDQFVLHYDAQKDKYQFLGDIIAGAHFYASMFNFESNFGVVVIRTFLDKVSHHKIKDDGTSEAVSFQEIRMFRKLMLLICLPQWSQTQQQVRLSLRDINNKRFIAMSLALSQHQNLWKSSNVNSLK